jgi:hypothetical protein
MSTSNLATTTRDAIAAQKDKVTRIIGEVTLDDVDTLEEELGGVLVSIKSNHYEQGAKFGHLAVLLGETRMRTILGNPAFTYDTPTYQGAYNPAALAATAAARAQMEAVHKSENNNHEVYVGVEAGTMDLISYAVGEDKLAPLSKRFIGFGDETPQSMITHIRKNVCLKMTTAEKEVYKREGYAQPWDTTKNVTVYFKYVEDFRERLNTRGIVTSDGEQIMAGVARMFESEYFTEEKMIDWESKDDAEKTWNNVKIYFTALYQSHEQFSKATARNSTFREKANMARQLPPSIDTPTATSTMSSTSGPTEAAMMMAALQESHQEQLNRMQEGHEKALTMATEAMTQMAAQVRAISDLNQRVPSSTSTYMPIPTDLTLNTQDDTKSKGGRGGGGGGAEVNNETKMRHGRLMWKKMHHCKNCKKDVLHFEQDCLSLPENRAKAEAAKKKKDE